MQTNKRGVGQICHSDESDKDPVLVIDYGKLTAITSIRVFNRNDCCAERIDGATVSITADKDGRDVVWLSTFDGAKSTYTFQVAAAGV